MPKKEFLIAASVIALTIVVGSTVYANEANVINIRRPETIVPTAVPGQTTAQSVLPVPPLIPPPNLPGKVDLRAGVAITPPDTRKVARIEPSISGLVPVSATYPQGVPTTGTPSYAILSSIEYTYNGKTVYVTTARPNTEAAQRPNLFGNETVQLANGTTAYVVTNQPGPTANRVMFAQGDLIITVASDLSISETRNLAARVSVN